MRRLPLLAALAATLVASGTALAVSPAASKSPVPSLGAVTAAPADSHARRVTPSSRVRAALGPSGELRGVSLNNVNNFESPALQTRDFARMVKDGITSVTAYVYLYVDSPTASSVHTGQLTPTDAELQITAKAAQTFGLAMHLMPVLIDPSNACRCEYTPNDVTGFFASYQAQVQHYADLAQQLGVAMLYVGSENDYIARYTAQWRALIANTRKHYSGALAYMSTGYLSFTAKWWDALDIAAVSPYYSLGDEKVQSYSRMMSAWNKDHLPYLQRVAKNVKIPLILGEIGYRSETGGYNSPAVPQKLGLPSPQVQAEAYRALLDAVKKSGFLYGVNLWRWGQVGPTVADTGYAFVNKPAECVLASRWSTDSAVRTLAGLPVCDLSKVDTVTNTVAGALPVH